MPTITYNIPAGAGPDLLDALRKRFNMPAATQAEIILGVEREFKKHLRDIYRDHMRTKNFDVVLD